MNTADLQAKGFVCIDGEWVKPPKREILSPVALQDAPEAQKGVQVPERFRLVICGQIRGGKNNMIVTRTGLHFPKPEWAKWRNEAVTQIKDQLSLGFKTITEPVNVRVTYVTGDRRRRDQPAILDSIFHVLEKAGVVTDDTLIWVSESSRSYDKDSPRCEIEFLQ